MKKLFYLFFLLAITVGSSYGQETSAWADRPDGYTTTFSEGFVSNNNAVRGGGCEFLVFRDNLPWNSSAVTDILTANGESFTVAGSAQMATLDFSLYDVIIIESDQVHGFHVNFQANHAKFTAFVTAGGRLEVHSATNGWNSLPTDTVVLPGGAYTNGLLDHYNIVNMPTHPIVAGVSSPFYGNYASHGFFLNLVPGTDIITTSQLNGLPTTIQYSYGTGTVTATCCTYEFGYSRGEAAGTMLENNLNYSCNYTPPPPPGVPVNNWALVLGILLISIFMVVRYRRNLA